MRPPLRRFRNTDRSVREKPLLAILVGYAWSLAVAITLVIIRRLCLNGLVAVKDKPEDSLSNNLVNSFSPFNDSGSKK